MKSERERVEIDRDGVQVIQRENTARSFISTLLILHNLIWMPTRNQRDASGICRDNYAT